MKKCSKIQKLIRVISLSIRILLITQYCVLVEKEKIPLRIGDDKKGNNKHLPNIKNQKPRRAKGNPKTTLEISGGLYFKCAQRWHIQKHKNDKRDGDWKLESGR